MHNSTLDSLHEFSPTELLKQSKILRQAQYFVGIGTSELDHLWEKQLIFLVLAGMKPVSEVYSNHEIEVPDGWISVGDNLVAVEGFLDTLNLAHHVFDSDGMTMAVVARTPQLVKDYMNSEEEDRRGLLFGYPATAVQAFVEGDTITSEQRDYLLKQEGLPDAPFALSREHYREEIGVLHRWQGVLLSYGLTGSTDRRVE